MIPIIRHSGKEITFKKSIIARVQEKKARDKYTEHKGFLGK
jgi:hypothetical protein